MKIIYYTDQIYLHGGLERVLSNKLKYFSTHTNYDLHIITFQQGNNPACYEIPENVTLHDLDIRYNRNISYLNPKNSKLFFKHYTRLKRTIQKINPDVIVVCNYEFGFYFIPLIAGKALKIKEFHSSKHFDFLARNKNKNILKKIQYRITDYFESKYDKLVVLTPDETQYYTSKNITVIPNGQDVTYTEKSQLTNKKIISAGRIAPVKGFEHLISAWKDVAPICKGWKLEIYGEGDPVYTQELQNQINILNLNDSILLKGSTNNINQKMTESSIYVMSSLTECYPMVLLEAMCVGLPIVSFDCPNGPRNIIKDQENGLLVEYLNNKKLAQALILLIKDEAKRKQLGAQSSITVLDYTNEIVMKKWLDLFNSKIVK
ncbi:glycosyltransferase family 4 protein [Tamlana sp. 2_MG-2023]|uniref:glycosyltransferase family 4 protein n=1 Tax=unclassified Tamlana TaxID=2614803 RepID=UPI0026E2A898|nr:MULTISPECIES: glycosyltransferase family 4 protein [unclassified Tamlana]MDO6759416.1 glycosyltransferase family 4 protein [Tamlana sp. 2_MG-2023]MDO6790445.1 glycosyltransferase family 4 protein [Tamlana sp. 1_MG-2023]